MDDHFLRGSLTVPTEGEFERLTVAPAPVDDDVAAPLRLQFVHHVGAQEAGTAGDDDTSTYHLLTSHYAGQWSGCAWTRKEKARSTCHFLNSLSGN
jgi:hypothetical protein